MVNSTLKIQTLFSKKDGINVIKVDQKKYLNKHFKAVLIIKIECFLLDQVSNPFRLNWMRFVFIRRLPRYYRIILDMLVSESGSESGSESEQD